jgi:hypothetical protein
MWSMRKIISIFFLSVYSIVLAHNIIPHEHHSDFSDCPKNCETKNIQILQNCVSLFHKHGHETHSHLHCHFNVKPLLAQVIKYTVSLAVTDILDFTPSVQEHKLITCFYYSQKIPDPPHQDLTLRAPPLPF